jgi:hypothetical protein
MTKFQIKVKIVLRDKNGKIKKIVEKECNSYVKQIISALRILMGGAAAYITDTTGTPRSKDYTATILLSVGGSGNAGYGIIVGTGDTAVEIDDYVLETPITNGIGAGQLQYGATSFIDVVIIGSTAKFTISRTLTNDSGDDIDVKEVALYSANTQSFMLERTLLPFTVADGESGTVTYTISCTV